MRDQIIQPLAPARRIKSAVWLLVMMLLCVSQLWACAQVRKLTYPADYIYLEQKDIDSAMVLLSLYIREMDALLSSNQMLTDWNQRRILELLSLIDSTTDRLGASNITTNHLAIDEHLDDFKSDLFSAISAAKTDPPNYFPAGEIAGSCTACHCFQ